MNSITEKYAAVEKLTPQGRTLVIETASGRFGEEGTTRDITSHAVVASFGRKNSNTVKTHGVLLVPKWGTSALLFVERSAGVGGSSELLPLFKEDFQKEYPDYTMQISSLVESEAWLKSAQLEKVTGVLFGHDADITSKSVGKVVGDLEHTLKPRDGANYLPHKLWEALRDKTIDNGALLAFPQNEEPDEVAVVLSGGGTRKRFLLGKEKTPSINYLLTDTNESAKNASAVLRYCLDQANSLFGALGVEWDYTMSAGAWTANQLAVTMER